MHCSIRTSLNWEEGGKEGGRGIMGFDIPGEGGEEREGRMMFC